MKKVFFLLLLLIISRSLYAQSNRFVDSIGVFKWQYHRSVVKDIRDPNSLIVTIVFVNGDKQTAVSYRQETFKSTIEWIETESGETAKEGNVALITANLIPNHSFIWRFRIKNNAVKKDNSIDLEKAAFLIMNEQFQVRKEKYLEQHVY